MSYYAGFDVSMKRTSIAIVNEEGKICFETICETDPEVLVKTLNETGLICERIGIESGCLSHWLVDDLKKMGLPAICIESRQMSALISLKINKTDKNDARLIANAMRCNLYKEVFHKSKDSIDLGLQMGSRRVLLDTRTKLKNATRGLLKTYGIRLGFVSHEKFSETVRNVLKTFDECIQQAIEGLLMAFEGVCRSIEQSEETLKKLCKKDPVIALFESIPGVGTITALTYKAVIDDPNRFTNPRNVGAYLGLTPRQYSSGDTIKQGKISKCGSIELRALLIECAIVLLTRTQGWTKLKAWGLRIMKRSGINKAAAAVARKLAIIMLRMWQKGETFIWSTEKNTSQAA